MSKIVAIILSSVVSIPVLLQIFSALSNTSITFENGIQIIKATGYPINENLKWHEIKAMGVKITETSFNGFLQICERLVLDYGNIQVYADIEARVIWIYADPFASESEREVYYVRFS
jgi:hypothetical protein